VEEITTKLTMLYTFPMSMMIYMDINASQERQLFSDINMLPCKIVGNLVVLRDPFYKKMERRRSLYRWFLITMGY
jgi:DNA sulfur modification protein DndB